MREHMRQPYGKREDEPCYKFGDEAPYEAIPHPYYRREVVYARAGGRDIQTKITWWCDYYASV